MGALFKQIFKSFLKNGFLVFGLLVLLVATLFISTTSIQVVSVLNSSVNGLNNKGNDADVTSKAVKNFGTLAFSYDTNPIDDTKQIVKSSLQLQGGDNPTWSQNRIYPYRYDEIYNADGSNRSRPQMGSGLNYNSQTKTVTVNESDPNGFWTENYGTLLTLAGSQITDAISYGLVGEDNNVLFDPQKLIFTAFGAPMFDWNDGALTNGVTVLESFAKPNKSVIQSDTDFDPNLAFTRCETAIVNQLHKGEWFKTFTPKKWKLSAYTSGLFPQYALGFYTHVVPAKTYAISLNLEKSRGPVKQILTSFPEMLNLAFNDLFSDMLTTDPLQANVSDFLEIKDNQILLNLDDSYFNNNAIDFETKKKETLKNFTSYLTSNLNNRIETLFFEIYADILAQENISVLQANESFYKEGDEEFLFVLKNKDAINNVVINQGLDLGDNTGDELLDALRSRAGDFVSKSSILAFINFAQSCTYSPNSNGEMDFFLACLQKFGDDLRSLLQRVEGEIIPDAVINSPAMARFALIFRGMSFKGSGTAYSNSFNWSSGQGYFSYIYSTAVGSLTIFDNIGVVVNTAYAEKSDKSYLPMAISQTDEQIWSQFLESIKNTNNRQQKFETWLSDNPDLQVVPWFFAKQVFNNNQDLFSVWVSNLDEKYAIDYQGNKYIIIGTGNAPDFAFPIISPTSPIPNPKLQAIVYMNESGFNSLGLNAASIDSYYSYQVKNQTVGQGVAKINEVLSNLVGDGVINALPTLENESLGTVWLRTYFPIETFIGISTVSITACVVLILLSIIVIFLLFKALTQNIMPALAICMANGTSFKKILTASLLNVGILTTFASLIGYVIGYLTQSMFLNIVNPIWFLPQVLISFNPWLLVGGIAASFLIVSAIFYFILRFKFKRPIPEILANKESLKTNAANTVLRHNNAKVSSIVKLSYGLSSTKLGRLCLLTALFSVALGASVSTVVINSKFAYSQDVTNQVNDYTYGFDLSTPNEYSGIYKSQPYAQIGFTDASKGIESIYTSGRYPYSTTELKSYEIAPDGKSLTVIPDQYFANFLLPSYQAYNDLGDENINLLFNTTASLFLLDTEFSLLGQSMHIWDTIKGRFPNWVVYQLESHLLQFKLKLFGKYREYYSQFLTTNKATLTNKSYRMNFENVTKADEGMYQASFKKGFWTYTSAPTFLWVDNNQIYTPNYSSSYPYYRVETNADQNIFFEANNYKNVLGSTATPGPNDSVTWTKATVNPDLELDPGKTTQGGLDLNKLKYNSAYLTFLGLVYADPELAELDSKISFGIVPIEEKDEKYTKVETSLINLKGDSRILKDDVNLTILGVQDQSQYINLINEENKNLFAEFAPNLTLSNNYKIIINNGAAYKYNLRVGDEFEVQVNNSSFNNSAQVMNGFIDLNNNFTPTCKFSVAGIVNDSHAEKFYLDLDTANRILGLDNLETTIGYSNTAVQRTAPLEKPFNGVFSDKNDPALLLKGVSYYSNYGFWNQEPSISSFENINIDLLFDMYITHDELILQATAQQIKNVDPTFDTSLTGDALRAAVINYFKIQYSDVSVINEKVIEALNDQGNNNTTKMINSQSLINDLFTTMSSLSTSLIITSISMLAPVLVLVSLICMLSLINDYLKLIGLLKVLGFSDRNIIMLIGSILLPVLILTIGLGLGIVFATTYGLQFAIYSLTQIFISPGINAASFFIGLGVIGGLMILCVLFLYLMMKRTKLQNVIKF